MKKILFGCLLLLSACTGNEDSRSRVKYDPDSRRYASGPREIFSSMRVIPLRSPSAILIDALSEVRYENELFFVVETDRRKRVDVFDAHGRYVGSVAACGRGGSEYLDIAGFQIVDSMMAIYSYHNKSLYFYRTDGTFVKKEPLEFNPLQLLKDSSGYWGYTGHSGVLPERVVRMDAEGKITEKFMPAEGPVIPLSTGGGVFTKYGAGVLVCEPLRNKIARIGENGKVGTFLEFDFGKYNVPEAYFTGSDPYAAAEKLMKSNLIAMDRFFVNEDHAVLSVLVQTDAGENNVSAALGAASGGAWKWLKSRPEGPLSMFFSSVRQLTPGSDLVLIADGGRIREFSAKYPDLIPEREYADDNPYYIVLCRLK